MFCSCLSVTHLKPNLAFLIADRSFKVALDRDLFKKPDSLEKRLECWKGLLKSYETLNVYYSNNHVNTIERLTLAMKISVEVLSFFSLFGDEMIE